jgi:hypothetical protein
MKKNHFVVIRFGSPAPISADKIVFEQKLDVDQSKILVNATLLGLIFVFNTNNSIEEVSKAFREAEKERNDTIPFVILDLDDATSIHNLEMFDITKMINTYKGNVGLATETPTPTLTKASDLSLDQLLDRIKEVGKDGLTSDENKRLTELTKN